MIIFVTEIKNKTIKKQCISISHFYLFTSHFEEML